MTMRCLALVPKSGLKEYNKQLRNSEFFNQNYLFKILITWFVHCLIVALKAFILFVNKNID